MGRSGHTCDLWWMGSGLAFIRRRRLGCGKCGLGRMCTFVRIVGRKRNAVLTAMGWMRAAIEERSLVAPPLWMTAKTAWATKHKTARPAERLTGRAFEIPQL